MATKAFVEPQRLQTIALLIEEIQSTWQEHLALERTRIKIDQRLGAMARARAQERLGSPLGERPAAEPEDFRWVNAHREWLVFVRRATWLADRQLDRQLGALVRSLPITEPALAIHGFGLGGLAGIIGFAGNLSRFPRPDKLWKWMGLAVREGKAQKLPTEKVSQEELLYTYGYNPRRRAHMFIIGTGFVKAGGPMREKYDFRKALEQRKAQAAGLQVVPAARFSNKPAEWRATHIAQKTIHLRAQRWVEKDLLRTLWQLWRDVMPDPTAVVPIRSWRSYKPDELELAGIHQELQALEALEDAA
jgi:hypothetical protein